MRTVNVYLTAEQLTELASGRNQAAGTQEEAADVVILEVDGCGGVLVAQAEHILSDAEGAGVWMDAGGAEHFSAPADPDQFQMSKSAMKFEKQALIPVEEQ